MYNDENPRGDLQWLLVLCKGQSLLSWPCLLHWYKTECFTNRNEFLGGKVFIPDEKVVMSFYSEGIQQKSKNSLSGIKKSAPESEIDSTCRMIQFSA